jgi:hypothetical protein
MKFKASVNGQQGKDLYKLVDGIRPSVTFIRTTKGICIAAFANEKLTSGLGMFDVVRDS